MEAQMIRLLFLAYTCTAAISVVAVILLPGVWTVLSCLIIIGTISALIVIHSLKRQLVSADYKTTRLKAELDQVIGTKCQSASDKNSDAKRCGYCRFCFHSEAMTLRNAGNRIIDSLRSRSGAHLEENVQHFKETMDRMCLYFGRDGTALTLVDQLMTANVHTAGDAGHMMVQSVEYRKTLNEIHRLASTAASTTNKMLAISRAAMQRQVIVYTPDVEDMLYYSNCLDALEHDINQIQQQVKDFG